MAPSIVVQNVRMSWTGEVPSILRRHVSFLHYREVVPYAYELVLRPAKSRLRKRAVELGLRRESCGQKGPVKILGE